MTNIERFTTHEDVLFNVLAVTFIVCYAYFNFLNSNLKNYIFKEVSPNEVVGLQTCTVVHKLINGNPNSIFPAIHCRSARTLTSTERQECI